MRGAEVSPVPAERADPLFAGVIEVGCHNVGGVALAAAGHPDVGGCCGGVVADHEVRGGRGAALRAVRGAGVAKLDMFTHVLGGQLAPAAVTANGEHAVAAHARDGPGVAVGDIQVGVVAAGRNQVTGTDRLACVRCWWCVGRRPGHRR